MVSAGGQELVLPCSSVPAGFKPRAVVPKLSFDNLVRKRVVEIDKKAVGNSPGSQVFNPQTFACIGVTAPAVVESSAQASSGHSTARSSLESSAKLRTVPQLQLCGLPPSLQGCMLLGAPPPEEQWVAEFSENGSSSIAPGGIDGCLHKSQSDSEESSARDSGRSPLPVIKSSAPKRPAAVPKLSFRGLRHSPRGLRKSPRSFRSPLSSPGATIPEEPGGDEPLPTQVASLCSEDSSMSGRSYDSSASGALSSRSRQFVEHSGRCTAHHHHQDVPKLLLSRCQTSLQGSYLLGATPPEEPARKWQGLATNCKDLKEINLQEGPVPAPSHNIQALTGTTLSTRSCGVKDVSAPDDENLSASVVVDSNCIEGSPVVASSQTPLTKEDGLDRVGQSDSRILVNFARLIHRLSWMLGLPFCLAQSRGRDESARQFESNGPKP